MKETRKPPFGRYFLMSTSPGPSLAEAGVTERCLPAAREMNERQREAAGAEQRPVRVPLGPFRAGGQLCLSPEGRGGRTWGKRCGRGQPRPLEAEIARGAGAGGPSTACPRRSIPARPGSTTREAAAAHHGGGGAQ